MQWLLLPKLTPFVREDQARCKPCIRYAGVLQTPICLEHGREPAICWFDKRSIAALMSCCICETSAKGRALLCPSCFSASCAGRLADKRSLAEESAAARQRMEGLLQQKVCAGALPRPAHASIICPRSLVPNCS
jgi:hypothetical protein